MSYEQHRPRGDGPSAAATDATPAYVVRRSDRARRARLTVSADGHAVVVLPRRARLDEAAHLVERHRAWLQRHLARAHAEQARLAARPALGDGRQLMVAGEPMTVQAVDAGPNRSWRSRVEEVPGGLMVHLGRDGREAPTVLDSWLRGEARRILASDVALRAPQLGVTPGRLSIRDPSSRWASASGSGALSFSWRLILTPPYVRDAVVVHELAHLRIRGHGRTFWALVERHAPRTAEARRWLREHAREVREALT